ncbi:hypothetical protein PR003_g18854 [Phytophthora rubi]|uniref:SWIM-type domain-containing protein n=1 Tax=Phytophthora rubi TaxID=129364 RepID=A0A6A4E158_9STRA|nr:hypothetical protein PR003_g18854 [Phytophthora rubi]
MHEKAVLLEGFPEARQLLCRWHVITWLKKQATRLAPAQKKQVKGLMKALVYSRSSDEYLDAKEALLHTLGEDIEHPMDNIPHLGNNTNNRLECKWGEIKQVVEPHFTLDETISTLITLQRIAEDEYVAQYHEVGSRPDLGEDPELAALGMQISEYAFRMVSEQHAFAFGHRADYEIDLSNAGKATLSRPGTQSSHVVDTAAPTCNCIFMETCLLPCRHVMHFRLKCNYETVIPPLRTFSTRWIVHAPQNNIDEGDVGVGGFNKRSCAAIRKEPAVATTDKYV